MTKEREAMKLALEALEQWNTPLYKRGNVIKSLRQAIAEAEKQGPDYERGFIDGMQKQMQSSVDRAVNAMAKREWVGLTDEEVYPLANKHLHYQIEGYEVSGIYDLAQAIEAKLKEKNSIKGEA
jgi:sulfur relay (sulfurtransferase) complex TusBCD TusD component (DsrE family)